MADPSGRRPLRLATAAWLLLTALVGVLSAVAYAISEEEAIERASDLPTFAPSQVQTRFPAPPHLAPGARLWDSRPSIPVLRKWISEGRAHQALAVARNLTVSDGHDRDAVAIALGLLERHAGNLNRASEAFSKARAGARVLAPLGAWYEAETDFSRGRYAVATRECERYRQVWPTGAHADACLRLQARSAAVTGKRKVALQLASTYDETHEDAGIAEQIALEWALWASTNTPAEAVPHLISLARNHSAPLTHRVVAEVLGDLQTRGFTDAKIQDETPFLKEYALSLRRARSLPEAIAAFDALRERAKADPQLADWVAREGTTFAWRTRNWPLLISIYERDYQAGAGPEEAWNLFRAYSRAGEWTAASTLAKAAWPQHNRTKWWADKLEEIGRAHLLARDYAAAREVFDDLEEKGGWRGRRSGFFAAFATQMAGDLDDAIGRHTETIRENRAWGVESRYWRAKAQEAKGDAAGAEADRAWILAHEPYSWYGTLVRQGSAPAERPARRDGAWPGGATAETPAVAPPRAHTGAIPVAVPRAARPTDSARRLAALSFPLAPTASPAPPPSPPQPYRCPVSPPALHPDTEVFAEAEVEAALEKYVQEQGAAWPDLVAAFALAKVGLYDLSGPLFAAFYEAWNGADRSRSAAQQHLARESRLRPEHWRQFASYTRDYHHAARLWHDLHEDIADPALSQEVKRHAFPLAHGHYVWEHARAEGIDPFLVLGLMRAESTYSPLAVSRVGARGAMQIMPRTGHLLADLQHDTHFTAGDLDDPVLSVGYGITYLGLLMRRFDDAYPLAVASYNAGPHAVDSWLKGTGSEMPMDAWVEHIPFRETRQYVKTVSEYYATYLAIYPPTGAQIAVPPTPRGNHPEIVDF